MRARAPGPPLSHAGSGARRDAGAQEVGEPVQRRDLVLGRAPVAVLELAGVEAAFADHDAVGNAVQLAVGELDAGARVAVIEQWLEAGSFEGLELTVRSTPS